MKITDLDIERFGIWQSARLDGFSDGLTVVFGPNGSGKTTLMQFVRAIFYGRPRPGTARWLPRVHAGPQGGRIGVIRDGRDYVINRLWDGQSGSDDATVTDPDGTIHDATALGPLLGGVDEDVFNSLFTVGYREAEDFSLLAREALADRNFSTVSSEELRRVEQALAALDGVPASFEPLRSRRRQLLADIDLLAAELAEPPVELSRVRSELAELEAVIREVQTRHAEVDAEIARCEAAAAAQGRRGTGWEERLRALDSQIASWRAWQAEMQQQLAQLRQQLHQAQSRDCEPLAEHGASQLQRTRQAMTTVESQLAELARLLRPAGDENGRDPGAGVQQVLDGLRERVCSLCDQIAKHEILDEIAALVAECQQLQRCHAEIEHQLEFMLQRRRRLLQEFSAGAFDAFALHGYETRGLCRSHEHSQHLALTDAPAGCTDSEDSLAELRAEREALQQRLGNLKQRVEAATLKCTELEDLPGRGQRTRRLESLRLELAAVDEQIREASEQQAARLAKRHELEAQRESLAGQRESTVLRAASGYLRQLAEEDCELLAGDDRTEILFSRPDGPPQSLESLSRGEQDQVALCLRLSLVNVFAQRGSSLPLILDDVFVTSDSDAAVATARLLREFSEHHQVIFFTCHEHIARLFRDLQVRVRDLPSLRSREPVTVEPHAQPVVAPVPAESREVARVLEPVAGDDSLVVKVFRSEKDELTDKTVAADAEFEPSANWIFYTDLSTPVGDLSGIDEEATEVLESRDVQTVEDLLALAPDAAAMRFEEAGLTSEDIRAWQRQALLSCRIPMLRREDAELLVLCGVHTPERLASSHPDFVFERVSAFLRTEDGRRFRRTSNPFDKQVAINWVRWSAHARTLWQSRERSSLERRSAGAGHYGEEGQRYGSQGESRSASEASRTDGQSGRGGDGTSTRGTGNGTAGGRDRTTSGPERRSALGSRLTEGGGNRSEDSRGTTTRELRARSRRRRRRGHDSDRSVRLTAGSREARIDTVSDSAESAAEEAELRFYLQRAEPVEAAPSIGPKTAERLAKVDIVTVEDLLEANPETAASRLKHRRIKADTLRAWQAQAMLVCRIPQMRGHDAQILVGCDVMTPEELAAMRPADLFARVMPFVDSSEGERIVRNGKKPDLAEVTFWIECARQARSLSAA